MEQAKALRGSGSHSWFFAQACGFHTQTPFHLMAATADGFMLGSHLLVDHQFFESTSVLLASISVGGGRCSVKYLADH